jgi:hypothetical protein
VFGRSRAGPATDARSTDRDRARRRPSGRPICSAGGAKGTSGAAAGSPRTGPAQQHLVTRERVAGILPRPVRVETNVRPSPTTSRMAPFLGSVQCVPVTSVSPGVRGCAPHPPFQDPHQRTENAAAKRAPAVSTPPTPDTFECCSTEEAGPPPFALRPPAGHR